MTTQSLWTTQISYLCCSISFHNDYVAVIMFFQKQWHCHPCGRPRKLGLEWQTGCQSITRWGWRHFWELVFGGQNNVLCDGLLHQNIPLSHICGSQPNLYHWTKYAFHSQDHLFIPQDVRLVASEVIDWYQENNPIDRRNEICLKKIYGGHQEANLI